MARAQIVQRLPPRGSAFAPSQQLRPALHIRKCVHIVGDFLLLRRGEHAAVARHVVVHARLQPAPLAVQFPDMDHLANVEGRTLPPAVGLPALSDALKHRRQILPVGLPAEKQRQKTALPGAHHKQRALGSAHERAAVCAQRVRVGFLRPLMGLHQNGTHLLLRPEGIAQPGQLF